MKNILNEEINQMKYLFDYKKGIVISEQSVATTQTNYTVKDIQNKLIELGYKDALSNQGKIKNPADGRFGPATLNAVTQAIRTANTQAPAAATDKTNNQQISQTQTANTASAQTANNASAQAPAAATDASKLTTAKPELKTNQSALSSESQASSSQWCKENTIPQEPYFEKCFAGVGKTDGDAKKSLNKSIKEFNTTNNVRYKNRRASFWDATNSTLYEVWSTATLDKKTEQNRQSTLKSMKAGAQQKTA